MKFINPFKRPVSIQRQMENLNLTIDEIKFMKELTNYWFRDYKKILERIKTDNTLINLPFVNPEQLKLMKEQIEKTFIERFEKDALTAKDIAMKLKIFINSVL